LVWRYDRGGCRGSPPLLARIRGFVLDDFDLELRWRGCVARVRHWQSRLGNEQHKKRVQCARKD
jgi:hypothetical protein